MARNARVGVRIGRVQPPKDLELISRTHAEPEYDLNRFLREPNSVCIIKSTCVRDRSVLLDHQFDQYFELLNDKTSDNVLVSFFISGTQFTLIHFSYLIMPRNLSF